MLAAAHRPHRTSDSGTLPLSNAIAFVASHSRATVAFGSLAYHRSHGPPTGAPRKQQLGLALDLNAGFWAVLDVLA